MAHKFRYELINHFSVYTTGKEDLNEDWFLFGHDMTLGEALDTFSRAVTSTPTDNCFISFEGNDVLAYDPDTRDVTNMSKNFDHIEDKDRQWRSDRSDLKDKIADYCDRFRRANNAPTISEYFAEDEEHSDFDSNDIDFAGIVTCVEPSEYDMKEPYDVFNKYIYDNVKVVRTIDDSTTVCDWSGFVYQNYNAFREFSNKYLGEGNGDYDDDDDLTARWIGKIHLLLAGNSTDTIYKNIMETLEHHTEICDKYKEHIKKNLLPYALPENKKRYEELLQGGKREMSENLVPMPGADKLSELKAEYDPAVKKAIEDYEKGREFPDNGHFGGLENYHIIAELNDVVLGVRNTDYTYATWRGDSEYGVSGGNYMMSRDNAFEDFALRAQLIDAERYIDPDAEKEKCRNEIKDYFEGEELSDDTLEEITEKYQIALDSYKKDDSARHDVMRLVIEDYETDKMYADKQLDIKFSDEPLDLVEQDKKNNL